MTPAANSRRESSGDFIRGLVCGLPEPKRSRRPLFMLKAFIDDSGINSSEAFVLAGWLGSAKVFEAFADDWDTVLRMSPRIEYFKMADALALDGQFKGISAPSRDEKIRLLTQTIGEHRLLGISTVMSKTVFEHYFKDQLPSPMNRPFFHLFMQLISMVLRH
jgi:hypothetical protein